MLFKGLVELNVALRECQRKWRGGGVGMLGGSGREAKGVASRGAKTAGAAFHCENARCADAAAEIDINK